MPRKVLKAPTGSQMTNPTSGTGQGLDRCTEMTASMILKAYNAGPWASLSTYAMMLKLTEMLNNGRDSSAPEDMGVWFPAFLKKEGISSIKLSNTTWPGFATIMDCIDRGHVAIGGFDDYVSLRLYSATNASGVNPYKWSDPHGLGHVLLIVGYDTDRHTVVVHDPLRADPSGQPADYTWKGFQAAQFHDCTEVVATTLPYRENTGGSPMDPNYTVVSDGTWRHKNGTEVYGWILASLLKVVQPDHLSILGAPTSGQEKGADGRWRQTFATVVASQSSTDANDFRLEPLPDAQVAALQAQLKTASADNATLQSQLATANSQIKALQATQGSGSIPGAAEAVAALKAIQVAITAINAPRPNVTAPLPAQPN